MSFFRSSENWEKSHRFVCRFLGRPKTGRHFLLPPGGAVILSHDFCVDVIRPGLMSDMSSLDLIGPIMPEIHNLVFSWRFIKL